MYRLFQNNECSLLVAESRSNKHFKKLSNLNDHSMILKINTRIKI